MANAFTDKTIEMPTRLIEELRKDIRKFEERVNICEIYETNALSDKIGSDVTFLRHNDVRTTDKQKREIEGLVSEFRTNMIKLKRCRCVKKLEKK